MKTEVKEFRLLERNGSFEFWGVGPAYGKTASHLLERVPVNQRRDIALRSMRKMGRKMAKANNCPFNDATA